MCHAQEDFVDSDDCGDGERNGGWTFSKDDDTDHSVYNGHFKKSSTPWFQ
jgi:hypothetical protein